MFSCLPQASSCAATPLTQQPVRKAYIGTLDLDLGVALTGVSSRSRSVTFSVPVLTPGLVIAAQSVVLFDPAFPLLNGEAGGFVLSNGVLSVCQLQ
jgi:hypothetical protein